VVLLLLLVMRRFCGYGVWCSAVTRGGFLFVCVGVTNTWRFVRVTNYVVLRRGHQIYGVL
jgi:hypothetical protein